MKNSLVKYIAYSVIAISFISSCVTTRNYKYLSFFFDGVPSPNKEVNKYSIDTVKKSSGVIVANGTLNQPSKPMVFYHLPYKDETCSSCHNQNKMGELQKSTPELCFDCHENFYDKERFLHGPVGGGYCNTCHVPHKSEFEKLLVKPVRELCLSCHFKTDFTRFNVHKKTGNTSCLNCHNAHGGANKAILKEGLCLKCHESILNHRVVHGPVDGGFCLSCHDSHSSGKTNFLKQQGSQICLQCHDIEQLGSTESHKNAPTENCINCHDPHGSNEKGLLFKRTSN